MGCVGFSKKNYRVRIPVLPQGLSRLMSAINDDSLGYQDIADVIAQSPSIALRILGLANSAWSAPASEIHSLNVACGRLGLDVIRSVVTALTIAEVFNPTACPAFDGRRYWISALLTGEASAKLSGGLGGVEGNDARMAGLFRTIGLLWLADQRGGEVQEVLARRENESQQPLNDLLVEFTGLGYLEAGCMVARHWGLPEGICQGAFGVTGPVPKTQWSLADIVSQAASLASLLYARQIDKASVENAISFDTTLLETVYQALETQFPRLEQLADHLCQ